MYVHILAQKKLPLPSLVKPSFCHASKQRKKIVVFEYASTTIDSHILFLWKHPASLIRAGLDLYYLQSAGSRNTDTNCGKLNSSIIKLQKYDVINCNQIVKKSDFSVASKTKKSNHKRVQNYFHLRQHGASGGSCYFNFQFSLLQKRQTLIFIKLDRFSFFLHFQDLVHICKTPCERLYCIFRIQRCSISIRKGNKAFSGLVNVQCALLVYFRLLIATSNLSQASFPFYEFNTEFYLESIFVKPCVGEN